MQIPESVEKITTTVPSSSLISPQQKLSVNINELVLFVKKYLTLKEQEQFEQGLAYFNADTSSDRQIIKNFIRLLSEAYSNSITTSNIDPEHIDSAKSSLKQTFETFAQNIESFLSYLATTNKQTNLLDSKQVSLIILGYAIGTIKRLHRS